MKKIFIAFSVLFAIALGAGPSMAVVGTLDDVKGVEIVAPFFFVEIVTDFTTAGEDTLLVVQELDGVATDTTLHWRLYDIDSAEIYDDTIVVTPWGATSLSVKSGILENMPSVLRDMLRVDADGDGTNDHWAGYIIFQNVTRPNINHLGGWVYQVNLPAGKAACSKLVSREWALGWDVLDQGLLGTYTPGVSYIPEQTLAVLGGFGTAYYQREVDDWTVAVNLVGSRSDYEGFSANSLAVAIERGFGYVLAAPTAVVDDFHLTPRYYLYDSNAATYFFIWTNRDPNIALKHIFVRTEDERSRSIVIPLTNQLNIIYARTWIPTDFLTAGGYGAGIFDIGWDLTNNYGTPLTGTNVDPILNQDWIAYSYQQATAPTGAAASWNVLERVFTSIGTL